MTPLLAGLLEVDPLRIWSFERFFAEVQAATSTKPVHVFHVNKAASIKVSAGYVRELFSDMELTNHDVSAGGEVEFLAF